MKNMETDFEIGEPLIVELENEILIGELKLISADGRVVELTNVKDFNSGYVYTSSQCLPRPLIRSMRKCVKAKENNSTNTNKEQWATAMDHPPDETAANITRYELDRMQEVIAAATYIFQTDKKYHKAVADIRNQSIIALHVEPTQFGRHNRTSLLTVATSQNVYIFDLVLLGKLFSELKSVLQSQCPKKITHYSNKVADSLKYQHGVELTGVFDTYVAHCLISGEKSPITFDQCAIKYFNIPENHFQGEDELQTHIYQRPLPRSHLNIVSKKVVYLYKLYERMLHDIMLKNFYKQCNDFSVAFVANKDDVEVAMQMRPGIVQGADCIGNKDWADLIDKKLNLTSTLNDEG